MNLRRQIRFVLAAVVSLLVAVPANGTSTTAAQTPALVVMRWEVAQTGYCLAARGGAIDEAFHYTSSRFLSSIEKLGLKAGSYATPNGTLSPLQAQIDLALSPNRGLPDALLRIDLAGLRQAGYQIPEITQIPRSFNMPGGGYEMLFPYPIRPEFILVIKP